MVRKLLKFCSWNIEGVTKKISDKNFIRDIKDYDFVTLVETWLPHDLSLEVDGFYSFSKSRNKNAKAKRFSGGISLLVKSDLRKGIKILNSSHEEFLWWKVDKNFFKLEDDIYVCSMYLPPQSSCYQKHKTTDYFSRLEDEILKYNSLGKIILCGDLNARTSIEPDYIVNNKNPLDLASAHFSPDTDTSIHKFTRCSRDQAIPNCNSNGKQLINLCKEFDLRILNGRCLGDSMGQYTCFNWNGCSVVDYCVASDELLNDVLSFQVMPLTELSKHCLIWFALKTRSNILTPLQNNVHLLNDMPISYKWNALLKEKFLKSLSNPNSLKNIATFNEQSFNQGKPNMSDINFVTTQLTSILTEAAKNSLPVKSAKKNKFIRKRKWFTENCNCLRKKLRTLGKSLSKFPLDPFLRGQFFSLKRQYKKEVKLAKKCYEEKLMNKIEEVRSSSPKEYWNLIKMINNNGKENKTSDIDSLTWFNYFKKLSNKTSSNRDEQDIKNLINGFAESTNDILDNLIAEEEVDKAVKLLKNKKAHGLDSITNEMIKASLPVLGTSLVKLFNLILSSGFYPSSWCDGFIVPIFKSGDRIEPSNYRGITVSSCFGKLFSVILNNRIVTFLNKNNILSPAQIGFVKGCRTADHVFALKTILDTYKSKQKPIYACFIDFRKAFDNVWRYGMFVKLVRYGLSLKVLKLLLSMYSKLRSCVKVGHRITNHFETNIGVRQGCNLSPTLFNLFLNDLPECFSANTCPVYLHDMKINVLMYADDVILISDSPIGLQNSLNDLLQYCDEWKLEVNLKKTKIIAFHHRKNLKSNFYLGNDVIEQVDQYEYLGVIFHKNGNFTVAWKNLYCKAMRAYFSLRKNFNIYNQVQVKTLTSLFDTFIVPVLTYCSEIWGAFLSPNTRGKATFTKNLFNDSQPLEKLHIRFCKQVLGIHSKGSNYGCRSELGRIPLSINIYCTLLKYWFRLVSSESNTVIYKALLANNMLFHRNRSCWLTTVDFLLNLINKKTANYTYMDEKETIRKCRNTLTAIFIRKCQETLLTNKKLAVYKEIKHNYLLETYLSDVKDFNKRVAVTKLRLSAHNLPVETGRYSNTPKQNRVCTFCNLGEVGDEFHYCMVCPHHEFQKLRDTYMQKINLINTNFYLLDKKSLFSYLISMADKSIITTTSTYFYKLLKLYNFLITE